MKFLLDTCVISDFVKGNVAVMQRLKAEQPGHLAISTITVMEIEFGLRINQQRAKKLIPVIDALLDSIHVLPYQTKDAVATATIRSTLRKQGNSIGPYDVMIAGCAMSSGLIMVTSNTGEFERVTGLDLEDWRLE